ncbi:MAG: PEP-CTERM sorting domain-containing protein [Burkholderiales bacterium]
MRKAVKALVLAAGMSVAPAGIAALTFDLNYEFSGGATPSGSIMATFEDWATDTVRLTVDLGGLSGTEFVSGFYFNYDPGTFPLSFTPVSGQAAASVSQCIGGTSCNAGAHKADGDGFFDLVLNFATSGSDQFAADELSVYDIVGSGLTQSRFNLGSVGGAKGAFHAAAHVQAIGPQGDSGWVGAVGAIPEPEAYALLLAGLGLLGFAARRRGAR